MDVDSPFSKSTLSSPPTSPTTPRSNMHIDLSTLPPPQTPSPPSNTLLITNLQDVAIFTAPILEHIRDLLASQAPLNSFSPLKSFRRIVVSFASADKAFGVRERLDGADLMGHRVRVFFGEPTPTDWEAAAAKHLAAPAAQKMFFISPPPSPPAGWEMRNEDPPNKAVHAEDLATALARLHAKPNPDGDVDVQHANADGESGRRRGSSTIVYHPDDHGGSPGLPAVMVEDTTETLDGRNSLALNGEGESASLNSITHTARPPLDAMDCS